MTTVLKRRRKILRSAPHMNALKKNLCEIDRLLEIHKEIAGPGPGHKHNVQVLNKSAIVLLLACWEAYVEDLALNCFNYIINNAKNPSVFPDYVLSIAAKEITKEKLSIWGIANDGWKDMLNTHKDKIIERYIERNAFNTPSAKNIDKLFSELIGFKALSRKWFWSSMSIENSKEKLENLIELRGNIAHRVQSSKAVTKAKVIEYRKFILRLAAISHNRLTTHIHKRIGKKNWRTYRVGKTT